LHDITDLNRVESLGNPLQLHDGLLSDREQVTIKALLWDAVLALRIPYVRRLARRVPSAELIEKASCALLISRAMTRTQSNSSDESVRW